MKARVKPMIPLCLVLITCAILPWLLPTVAEFDPTQFSVCNLTLGMTRAEVERRLGPPFSTTKPDSLNSDLDYFLYASHFPGSKTVQLTFHEGRVSGVLGTELRLSSTVELRKGVWPSRLRYILGSPERSVQPGGEVAGGWADFTFPTRLDGYFAGALWVNIANKEICGFWLLYPSPTVHPFWPHCE